jgi:hypothetical protein
VLEEPVAWAGAVALPSGPAAVALTKAGGALLAFALPGLAPLLRLPLGPALALAAPQPRLVVAGRDAHLAVFAGRGAASEAPIGPLPLSTLSLSPPSTEHRAP